jgi:Spy/CpxP family protein refolding chaperone
LDGKTRLTVVVAAYVVSLSLSSLSGAEDTPTAARPRQPHVIGHTSESGLDSRVQMLTKALDLDTAQQAQLKSVLENQREQLLKILHDGTVPATDRLGAARAVGMQTADRIRALLTEEQRKKYKPPVQPHEPATGEGARTVEDWMKMAQPPAKPAAATP